MIFKFKNTVTFFIVALLSLYTGTFAQTPSQIRNIRIPLWAELDAYPEYAAEVNNDSESEYSYPIKSLREVSSYLIEGMVYGWDFVYTPSDVARGVEEYFEITPVQKMDPQREQIKYVSPWIEDNKLNCWCEFKRTDYHVQSYNLWSSIKNPTIKGRGKGALSEGFAGVQEAAKNAVKDAIRNHYRSLIKNKPKEITGRILIRNTPTLGIDAGQYIIILDFFLEYGKIIEYKIY